MRVFLLLKVYILHWQVFVYKLQQYKLLYVWMPLRNVFYVYEAYLPPSWSDRCPGRLCTWARCGRRGPRPGSGKGSYSSRSVRVVSKHRRVIFSQWWLKKTTSEFWTQRLSNQYKKKNTREQQNIKPLISHLKSFCVAVNITENQQKKSNGSVFVSDFCWNSPQPSNHVTIWHNQEVQSRMSH